MELAAAGADHKALREIAAKLIANALDGKMDAIKELADRTDGKVPQAIVGDNGADPVNVLHRIERIIVDPANPNSAGVSSAPEAGPV